MPKPSSENRIRETVLRMIGEQSYSEITMIGIAAEMDMTRQNLYRYYSSKEQILEDALDEKIDSIFKLVEQIDPNITDSSWENLVDQGASALFLNKDLILAVMNTGEDKIMKRLVTKFIKRCMGHLARKQGITINDRAYFELLGDQISGGSYALIKGWSDNDMDISPEKIADALKIYSGSSMQKLFEACE